MEGEGGGGKGEGYIEEAEGEMGGECPFANSDGDRHRVPPIGESPVTPMAEVAAECRGGGLGNGGRWEGDLKLGGGPLAMLLD